MQIINQDYALVPIGDLQPHPRNPRKGNTAAIAESIGANGFYGAVVAQRSTGYILAGNHRWMAAKEQGAAVIPCVWVDCDDEEALRILLADNRTNDLAAYDDVALAEILKGLDDLAGTGYDQAAVDALLEKITGEELQIGAEDQSGQLTGKFEVIVFCSSEQHQAETLDFLVEHGYECKALIA
jgi:ParB-like chromosome segregation protein Spo0J